MGNWGFIIILFALTANSLDAEPAKRFGCHSFSSVEKIANMESSNNELLRNLRQCMRDTGTYNEKNLETAKKLNDEFVQATEKMSYTTTKKLEDFLSVNGLYFSPFLLDKSLLLLESFNFDDDAKLAFKIGLTGTVVIYVCLFANRLIESKLNMKKATENKWLTAVKIKNFIDILQKNN